MLGAAWGRRERRPHTRSSVHGIVFEVAKSSGQSEVGACVVAVADPGCRVNVARWISRFCPKGGECVEWWLKRCGRFLVMHCIIVSSRASKRVFTLTNCSAEILEQGCNKVGQLLSLILSSIQLKIGSGLNQSASMGK